MNLVDRWCVKMEDVDSHHVKNLEFFCRFCQKKKNNSSLRSSVKHVNIKLSPVVKKYLISSYIYTTNSGPFAQWLKPLLNKRIIDLVAPLFCWGSLGPWSLRVFQRSSLISYWCWLTHSLTAHWPGVLLELSLRGANKYLLNIHVEDPCVKWWSGKWIHVKKW